MNLTESARGSVSERVAKSKASLSQLLQRIRPVKQGAVVAGELKETTAEEEQEAAPEAVQEVATDSFEEAPESVAEPEAAPEAAAAAGAAAEAAEAEAEAEASSTSPQQVVEDVQPVVKD
jgi:hypothetical protein